MDSIELEVFVHGGWIHCGTLQMRGGLQSESSFNYDLDYFFDESEHGYLSSQVSVNCPLSLDSYKWSTIPPFAMDIFPAPTRRKFLAQKFNINSDADFLKYGASNTVGNIRTKLFEKPHGVEFNLEELSLEDDEFRELFAIRGGTDLQGDAPKVIAVKNSFGWFLDDGEMQGERYILKFPRGPKVSDKLILRNEFKYMKIANELGLDVKNVDKYFYLNEGILGIPRFDIEDGRRLGLESLYSVMDTMGGINLNQYTTCKKIYELTGRKGLVEYVKRDILNFSFGNTNNHGRNTAFLKGTSTIELSPLYDFAPMVLDKDIIIRTSKWAEDESSTVINWSKVISKLEQELNEDLHELTVFEEELLDLKLSLLKTYDVDREVQEAIL
ncbi:MAG: type II toxin-antitoxin system HipA family toxin [Lentisphaeraceae bacterium]|nr:type II toxin-antitoxin system HipA family toxin [Lentisphaeraceae bacterium]